MTKEVDEQKQKQIGDDADALLVGGVCALEDYLNEHQRACEKLKQGFLKLMMARRYLPAHALSDLSYHEHFEAVTVVAARNTSNDGGGEEEEDAESDVHWVLASPNSASAKNEEKDAASAVTQRKGKNSGDKEAAVTSKQPQQQTQQLDLQNSTIMWFSSLPPNDLRQAQKHFRSATSASKVQHSVSALQKM